MCCHSVQLIYGIHIELEDYYKFLLKTDEYCKKEFENTLNLLVQKKINELIEEFIENSIDNVVETIEEKLESEKKIALQNFKKTSSASFNDNTNLDIEELSNKFSAFKTQLEETYEKKLEQETIKKSSEIRALCLDIKNNENLEQKFESFNITKDEIFQLKNDINESSLKKELYESVFDECYDEFKHEGFQDYVYDSSGLSLFQTDNHNGWIAGYEISSGDTHSSCSISDIPEETSEFEKYFGETPEIIANMSGCWCCS